MMNQWKAISELGVAPPLFDFQETAARELIAHLRQAGAIAELVAMGGTGKTAILRRISLYPDTPFAKPPAYLAVGRTEPELRARLSKIGRQLVGQAGHKLLIVDDADLVDRAELIAGLRDLERVAGAVSAVTASRTPLGIGHRVELGSPTMGEFEYLLRHTLGERLSSVGAKNIWEATGGDVGSIPDLQLEIAPWRGAGLVAPDGSPLSQGDKRAHRIIADVADVSDAMLRSLAEDPESLHQLSPRRFEEVVAELLERKGYEVSLTPATRDGGRDLHAVRHDELGSFLYLVEAKKWAPDRPVGVEVVRSLRGVVDVERATAGVVVTTSRFTKPAQDLAGRIRYQMSLKDYLDLRRWLQDFRSDS